MFTWLNSYSLATRHTRRRLYRDMAQVVGSDPSWGFSGAIATALGCTPIDLEAPQELLLDPPPAQRYADAGEGCRLKPRA